MVMLEVVTPLPRHVYKEGDGNGKVRGRGRMAN